MVDKERIKNASRVTGIGMMRIVAIHKKHELTPEMAACYACSEDLAVKVKGDRFEWNMMRARELHDRLDWEKD